MTPLPERWQRFLVQEGESGMGYQTGDIRLRSGTLIPDVIFAEGSIVRVRYGDGIPFEVNDIEAIVLTHRRWDWSE